MNDLICREWLELQGYQPRGQYDAGWRRDFGEGHILNVVPHEGKWIVELWNESSHGKSGAPFRQLFTRQSELLFVQTFMEDVPF